MDQYIGKTLNKRYELRKLIGSGGMANVFEAFDLVEEKVVAVKILKQEYLTNEEFVRRFRNESKVVSMLNHPNIVQVYDVNFTGADQYIVMEYIDGITLFQYIHHQGKLRWKDALFFITQVLKALDHAHEHGVIHRDIKAQNIMLLRDGSIKVMDFGIARFAREDIRSMGDLAIGSVHYISPEQTCGEESDVKSDIYSVGILLYEMLCGSVPFDGTTPEEVALKHMKGGAIPLSQRVSDLPTGLCEIVEKAMQRDRNLRYRSAKEMLNAIDEFKQNPSIVFAYKYLMEETVPEEYNRSVDVIQGNEEMQVEKKIVIKRSPTISILLGIAFACGITAILVVLWFFYWNKEEKVPDTIMPNLVGSVYDEIKDMDEYKQFNFVIEERAMTDEYPAGVIYEQNVQPGLKVKADRTVKIKVSEGITTIYVPDLTGKDVSEAEQILYDMGLDYNIRTQLDESVPPDCVIRSDPPADTQVEKGSQVILYVSRAVISASNKMPYVIGQKMEEAKSLLESLGLVVETEEIDSDQEPGTVLTQSIARNEYITEGDTVVLEVSNGSDYYKEINLTVDFPSNAANREYSMVVYMDGEGTDSYTVNPGEHRRYMIVIKGNGTQTVTLSLDGVKYAEYKADFEAGTIEQTEGYFYSALEPEPGSSFEESSSSEESSQTPSAPPSVSDPNIVDRPDASVVE